MRTPNTTCPVCNLPRGQGHPKCSLILQARGLPKGRKARVKESFTTFNPQ